MITVFSDVTYRSSSDTPVSCCHATLRCILEDVILIIIVVNASDLRDLSLLPPCGGCRRASGMLRSVTTQKTKITYLRYSDVVDP